MPSPAARLAAVPARVLRRHAPARDDRHGARLQPAPADRGRADDGPRRHHAGRRRRPAAAPERASATWRSLFITHDLGVIAGFAEDVLVMYAGAPVELGTVDDVFARARPSLHPPRCSPPSRASPTTAPRRCRPSRAACRGLGEVLAGCRFEPRCPLGSGRERCQTERPALSRARPAHARGLPLRRRGAALAAAPVGVDAPQADALEAAGPDGARRPQDLPRARGGRRAPAAARGRRRRASSSRPASRWASWASRARARARWPAWCSACSTPTPAPPASTAPRSTSRSAGGRGACAGGCRWSSRIRATRSIPP